MKKLLITLIFTTSVFNVFANDVILLHCTRDGDKKKVRMDDGRKIEIEHHAEMNEGRECLDKKRKLEHQVKFETQE